LESRETGGGNALVERVPPLANGVKCSIVANVASSLRTKYSVERNPDDTSGIGGQADIC